MLVLADVGPSRGVGHVMRCLALAEELRARGCELTFVADLASVAFARRQVERRGFRWMRRPATESKVLEVVEKMKPDAVIVDSYSLPLSTYVALRRRAITLCLADGDTAQLDGDLVIDQNIGAEADPWPVPEGGVRLAGVSYALMRDEVLDARAMPDRAPAETPSVLAFFGGTDAFGAAPVVASILRGTGRPFRLTVVGATRELREELEALVPLPGQSIEVMEPREDLASEVRRADLVVSAAGSSSWELLCLGAACAFVRVADNQTQGYSRIAALGLAASLGSLSELRRDPGPATGTLAHLLQDPSERARMAQAGQALIDGRGRERVADALLRLCRPGQGAVG